MSDYAPGQEEELLRRCLLRVTLAARGRSADLDRALDAMKDAVVNRSGLESALETVSNTLLAQDQREPPAAAPREDDPANGSWLTRLAGLNAARPHKGEASDNLAEVQQQLRALLDALPVPLCLEPELRELRKALDQPLELSGLAPLLANAAELIRQTASLENAKLETFLNQIAGQLDHIHRFLHACDENHATEDDECRQLNADINVRVEAIRTSMNNAGDPWALRSVISEQLNGIIQHLDYYQRCKQDRQTVLAEQVASLNRRIASSESELETLRENLALEQRMADLDALTGLPNRHAYERRLEQEMERCRQGDGPLSLLVGDVDNFKAINDRFGHQTGDRVLRSVAGILQANIRQSDLLARYGGEEFVVILPGADPSLARQLADRLRVALSEQPFHASKERIPITISFGVATWRKSDTAETLFGRGDQAMYRAKRSGRNRVMVESAGAA